MNATRTETPTAPTAVTPLGYARAVPAPPRRSRAALTVALLIALWPAVLFAAAVTWWIVRGAFR